MTPPTPDGRHQPPSTYRIEMGLTSHGLRDIGDVTSIRQSPVIGKALKQNDPLLLIDWEGYAITSADELYHAVWENDEGTLTLNSPVSGTLTEIGSVDPSREGIDDTDVLAVVISKREELEEVAGGWLGEEEYRQILEGEAAVGVAAGGGRVEAEGKFTPVEGGWSG
eukprot:CAMPEP_0198253458 /NCGR_PEP_ID=MMETSP1447-20131203/3872_1 /TAXON_ID=420782 /ORGANISM="Chaetoceros dichaeta, Strain CCMP1751" /LENGTH=166 /DNA_ID=CAMNT_0043939127 /DNA_START=123 /DNA_END=626 /DNA_ORIENTATION=-